MRLVATFTAASADRIRNSRVELVSGGLTYEVYVGDERSNVAVRVLETPSLTEALGRARRWMDGIEEES